MLKNKEKIIEITNSIKPSHTIIWLHGLGADAQDSLAILNNLYINDLNIRFVCPNAPERCISVNHGLKMQAWYDIRSNSIDEDEDIYGIQESALIVQDLINKEKSRGIKTKNIILGGFSQGCAIALYVGLSITEQINSIIALSGYLPAKEHLMRKLNHHQDLDIFIAHGVNDNVISTSYTKKYTDLLKINGYKNIRLKYYNIGHSVCEDEMRDLRNMLIEMINKN